jgi:hypothetical protein
LSAFVDGYFALNFGMPKPQGDGNAYRAFDRNNGFGLSWAGLDVAYSAEQVGATVSLRFGPSASVLAGGTDTQNSFQFVKQAFATWRPGGGNFTLDFGKFDTIYGVEVADSQKNINYTRGLLDTLAQPHHHTGIRVGFSMDGFFATAMIVNGWNESIDKNLGKGLGLNAGYALKRRDGTGNLLVAKVGYLLSPESQDYANRACPPTNAGVPTVWSPSARNCVPSAQGDPNFIEDRGETNSTNLRHFLDFALLFTPSDRVLVTLNGNYGRDDVVVRHLEIAPETRVANWYGVGLAGRYRFDDVWGAGLRLEYLGDPDHHLCNQQRFPLGVTGLCEAAGIFPISVVQAEASNPTFSGVGQSFSMMSGTLTLEAAPVDHLLVRLDGRLDAANADVFPMTNEQRASQVTATLGVVATTD